METTTTAITVESIINALVEKVGIFGPIRRTLLNGARQRTTGMHLMPILIHVKGVTLKQTAVCIDAAGIGKVYGSNNAYFLKNETLGAETCVSGTPLTWNRNATAVRTYRIAGSGTGNGTFNATNWTFSGGTSFFYYVNNGVLVQN